MRYNDPNWCEQMRIRVDYNDMMADFLGENGIHFNDIVKLTPLVEKACIAMEEKRHKMKWRELPYNQNDVVEDIIKTAGEIALKAKDFVVLGIGGSALGPIALHQALKHLRYNDLPWEKRKSPRLFVEDNIDPERMEALLDVIDLENTVFNVITKSGGTSETMAQLLIITDIIEKKLGKKALKEKVIATTDEKKGNLIKIAKELGLKTFYVPDGVGGRFSELCPVGLLCAAVCGIDIKELLAGAAYMDELCKEKDVLKNPAYILALLQYIAMGKGCNISVMMPYGDSLKYMADWYAQLWAESLGKKYDNDGKKVYVGQTPVKALGVTDQHSQVQLYTQGPFDKVITFLTIDKYRTEYIIPQGFTHIPDVSFLCGHTLNSLIKAEQQATAYALYKSGHMSNSIIFPEVNPFTVGQFLYMMEMQTAFAGELLNINAFDQPGVEEGKNATYALLGKPGFEDKKKELLDKPPKMKKYYI